MSLLVEVFETNPRHSDQWGFEDWRCQRGDDCCSEPAAWLGNVLRESPTTGMEYGDLVYPFVVVMDDGTAMVVCEDCAVELNELRQEAMIAMHERIIIDAPEGAGMSAITRQWSDPEWADRADATYDYETSAE